METVQLVLLLLVSINFVRCNDIGEDGESSNHFTTQLYKTGVDLGIISPEKYSLEAFERDENNVFKDLYDEYISLNYSEPINYSEWIVMNNFGILADTKESLFERKITKRSTADNKRRFVNTVRRGDILVSGRGIGGIVGHAAIMTTDNIVLEMKGGPSGTPSNNRQLSKHKWFDIHATDWTTVYRVPNANVAREAARWADHKYYNPSGGATKTIHITYKIDTNIWKINPSYCSKLVIQAYYFGTGSKKVINDDVSVRRVIVPTLIPSYFVSPYKLRNMGKF
ncbi:uncharacterized protein LOC114366348 [Ostrinia furnacalis]|uniref:uncharacterized protein LOC114366348 n=1 Tax=Ostrinia furnacalis TaxID=93504 RepID=UPI00103EFE82|nr:uncharacterized protein LOC114366348 [Ostrinia furnacalis]